MQHYSGGETFFELAPVPLRLVLVSIRLPVVLKAKVGVSDYHSLYADLDLAFSANADPDLAFKNKADQDTHYNFFLYKNADLLTLTKTIFYRFFVIALT
jgi:hypothetical protein